MKTYTRRLFDFSASMEKLEDRIALSANPLVGMLADAHDQTGLSTVRTDFGFTGIGQTVAVIDSGIAYDHIALGDGLGQTYRVVGGWDFTDENDADPYDDGPSGSQGTHVSGIIGADAGLNTGVSPGVDLVALRVFDDAGAGYFSWVENALQWVHTNQNSFENPITAVNLSLWDASWNADSIPSWANLEDEFAQLEADGIFIAVSAGDSFTSYDTTGLSYPAASSYVVPVMSVDDAGNLSFFSQRHTRAIAAPGHSIVSTVPDYVGDGNGIADDYAEFSGTRMAAPYVAGASVIIREAMEFVGYTNITQDTIYDHMMATADSTFDTVTNENYSRLNMSAAIDALMPADDFGSSAGTAYDLGTITDTASISGVIGMLSDADFFTFTAGITGIVTFNASNMTHELEAAWSGPGQASGINNETYNIEVTAGETYTVGFSSAGGLGYYDLDITSEPTVDPSADFDSNGLIDGFDFLAWQRGFGTFAPNATTADGDTDNDLDVDGGDLSVWELQYGSTAPLISAASTLNASKSTTQQPLAQGDLVDVALAVALDEQASEAAVTKNVVAHSPPLEVFSTGRPWQSDSVATPGPSSSKAASASLNDESDFSEQQDLWEDAVDDVFASVFQ